MKGKKLNLGSGIDYKEGWINADLGNADLYSEPIKCDVKCDLNVFPYPFKDNQFEYIYMGQSLTYVKRIDLFISEINRIMKVGGKLKIIQLHFSRPASYSDINVINRFCLNAITLFKLFGNNGFELISKEFTTNNKFTNCFYSLLNLSNFTQRIYERFFVYIFPAQTIEWIFEKTK